jgi:hypothetical protein
MVISVSWEVYLSARVCTMLQEQQKKLQKGGVIAVGGGEASMEELRYAYEHNVPVAYVQCPAMKGFDAEVPLLPPPSPIPPPLLPPPSSPLAPSPRAKSRHNHGGCLDSPCLRRCPRPSTIYGHIW